MDLNKCKNICESLGKCSHNTKNRIIEKMVLAEKKQREMLADYLKKIIVIESLCNYICTCCCEAEHLTRNISQELKSKCQEIVKLCNKISSSTDFAEYINCSKMIQLCNSCSTSPKKTKKK